MCSDDLGRRVLTYLSASAGRERVGPFTAKLDAQSDIPPLNYAGAGRAWSTWIAPPRRSCRRSSPPGSCPSGAIRSFAGAARVQHDAYEETRQFTDQDVDRLRRMVARGGIAALARHREAGEPAGAGMCTPPQDGVTELAGIAVDARFRRRGVAGAVTSALVREALRRGIDTIGLTPGGDEAERVYRRAGFVVAGEVVHIGLP